MVRNASTPSGAALRSAAPSPTFNCGDGRFTSSQWSDHLARPSWLDHRVSGVCYFLWPEPGAMFFAPPGVVCCCPGAKSFAPPGAVCCWPGVTPVCPGAVGDLPLFCAAAGRLKSATTRASAVRCFIVLPFFLDWIPRPRRSVRPKNGSVMGQFLNLHVRLLQGLTVKISETPGRPRFSSSSDPERKARC